MSTKLQLTRHASWVDDDSSSGDPNEEGGPWANAPLVKRVPNNDESQGATSPGARPPLRAKVLNFALTEALSPSVEEETALAPMDPNMLNPPSLPVNVEVYFTVHELPTKIDCLAGSTDIRVFCNMWWVDPRLAGKGNSEVDWTQVWTPDLEIANAKKSEFKKMSGPITGKEDLAQQAPEANPEIDGLCYVGFMWKGTVSTEVDFTQFPFANAKINVFVDGYFNQCLTIDKLNLRPFEAYSDKSIMRYICLGPLLNLNDRNSEWEVDRMALHREVVGMTGKYTQMQLEIRMKQKPFNYLLKILLPLVMLAISAFGTLLIDNHHTSDRLSYAMTVFLATSAFLYMSKDDIPKLAYLTLMDKVNLSTFTLSFLMIAESMFCSFMFADKPDSVSFVDKWFAIVLGSSYGTFLLFNVICRHAFSFFKCCCNTFCWVEFSKPSEAKVLREAVIDHSHKIEISLCDVSGGMPNEYHGEIRVEGSPEQEYHHGESSGSMLPAPVERTRIADRLTQTKSITTIMNGESGKINLKLKKPERILWNL